jgi:hypothetical protein
MFADRIGSLRPVLTPAGLFVAAARTEVAGHHPQDGRVMASVE